jgi:GNAT superfamily N-acetyltransferase
LETRGEERDDGLEAMLIREAGREDLPGVVGLLADDDLGKAGDYTVVDSDYERAFDAVAADPRNLLVVAEENGQVIGCLQITYIPGLNRHGAERCLLETVHVRSDRRGHGIGGELMTWAIDQARRRGCGVVQLTSDKRRVDAHRFYGRLGFIASHEGMKLPL